MLPMIVTPAEHKPVFRLDDLRPHVEVFCNEAFSHLSCVQRSVRDVSHFA